jgi:hypothetical protein
MDRIDRERFEAEVKRDLNCLPFARVQSVEARRQMELERFEREAALEIALMTRTSAP